MEEKSMLKFSMFLKQSKYPRWSLSFPEVGEEANYLLVVFRGDKDSEFILNSIESWGIKLSPIAINCIHMESRIATPVEDIRKSSPQ